jgi:hypothetical protein
MEPPLPAPSVYLSWLAPVAIGGLTVAFLGVCAAFAEFATETGDRAGKHR